MSTPHAETNAIVLHGALAERFGGPFHLGVGSPAEAVRALMLMKPGFRDAIGQGAYQVIYGPRDTGMELGAEQLGLRLGTSNEVHIVPAAVGAGRAGGVGKIIMGIVLIAVAVFQPELVFAAGAAEGAFGIAGATPFAIGMFGFSMLLSGVASLMAPNPNNQAQKKHDSFLFSGTLNSIAQGTPVPLCYGGPIKAGSQVISLSYSVAEIPVNWKASSSTSGSTSNTGAKKVE